MSVCLQSDIVETPLLMHLHGDQMVGVMSAPQGPTSVTGVLVIVGGPQVRCGSHRLFVQLARAVAAAGHPVLRFDVRGMGDSTGESRDFESLDDDIATGIDTLLARQPHLRRVVLWGLCDGASASLLYLHRRRDERVGGLVLLNPWVRSPQSLAQARLKHYYWQRLAEGDFWRKLLRGGIGLRALGSWWGNLRAARHATVGSPALAFPERMALGWKLRPMPTLLVLAGRDITAQEFLTHSTVHATWRGWLHNPLVSRLDLPGADHTFSVSAHKHALLNGTLQWLSAFEAGFE
jgi:exosortase A-associated hydrolase 1